MSGNGSSSPNANNGNNGNTGSVGSTGSTGQVDPTIVNFTLNQTVDMSGARIVNQQGVAADGSEVTKVNFQTTDLSGVDLTLTQNLVGVVQSFYDDGADLTSPTALVLNEIKDYAAKIKCDDFKGKGTVEDYSELFNAASKIASDVKQIHLDVDVDGFNEFGAAADELSKLFKSFIVKLETVSIIDDLSFLRSISLALSKVWNLSEVFGKFKETILATATVQVPKSSHDAAILVNSVMSEVNCAMSYVNHFVNPQPGDPTSADLSDVERVIINKAVTTIDNWSLLCDQGVSIAMSNNPDIQSISTASSRLKLNASLMINSTSTLKSKLSRYNILQ